MKWVEVEAPTEASLELEPAYGNRWSLTIADSVYLVTRKQCRELGRQLIERVGDSECGVIVKFVIDADGEVYDINVFSVH